MEDLTLRQIRLAKEISLQEISEKLHIHPNTYAAWEKNPGMISVSKAFEIAEILETSVDDIFLKAHSTKC